MHIESANTTSRDLHLLISHAYHQLKNNEVVNPKAFKSTLTPLQAIRAKCLDCADTWYEVKKCSFTNCPTHLLRLCNNIPKGRSRVRAIRKYCVDKCMNGMKKEVKQCPSTSCPFYKFRMGKNPNRARRLDKLN